MSNDLVGKYVTELNLSPKISAAAAELHAKFTKSKN